MFLLGNKLSFQKPQADQLDYNIKTKSLQMDSKTKSLKNGEYEYNEKDKLGQGSFAHVYKGIITKNNRVVAVRLLPLTLVKQYGQKIKEIITGEVSVLKELSMSDNPDAIFTTRIYDCFMTANNVVMILEFCPDGNLEDVMKKGPLAENDALDILYQLARGLEFIANQKVVHRDIKPDNVFVKKQGHHKVFKLGDFGFAVKKELNNQIVGTPIFMSPELFRQERYGSEVDAWAFGLMAHYVLFKEYYFIGASEAQIKKKVLNENYQLKDHHLKKISKPMADFLTKCLKMNKKDRIPANQISQHPVFDSVRQSIDNMISEVRLSSSILESQLMRNSAKGMISSEILKYNFLIEFGTQLANMDNYNLASLYIYKHALGEMEDMRQKMMGQKNIIQHPQWQSFCNSNDYEKSYKLLKTVIANCEKTFQHSFNNIIPMVTNRYGGQVAQGIQQNLGNGPYSRINPKIIMHQLQNSIYPRIQQNKTAETHLLGLKLILSMSIYEGNKKITFDFTNWEMRKSSMDLREATNILEKYLRSE